MIKLYSITNWDGIYENHETRKLDNLRWIPQPNKHDGLGFRRMAMQRDAAELLAAWTLIVQVASKGPKGNRGALERDGTPLSAADLAMITGFPERIFTRAFDFFTQPQSGWLKAEDVSTEGEQTSLFIEKTGEVPGASRRPTDIGKERMEGNGKKDLKEGNRPPNVGRPTAEEIYEAYPRKTAKQDALKAIGAALHRIAKAQVDGANKDQVADFAANFLTEKVHAYAAAVAAWPEMEKKFIPHPATWFNRGSYDDDQETWKRNSPPPAKSAKGWGAR